METASEAVDDLPSSRWCKNDVLFCEVESQTPYIFEWKFPLNHHFAIRLRVNITPIVSVNNYYVSEKR